jgi:hypothetical protein
MFPGNGVGHPLSLFKIPDPGYSGSRPGEEVEALRLAQRCQTAQTSGRRRERAL